MLHIPRSSTYEAVDGLLVVPDECLIIYAQVTVSPKHPIKYKFLKEVYDTLMQQRVFQGYTHILLFMVKHFDNFTSQPYQNQNGKNRKAKIGIDMKQYVGKVDSEIY